jgi:hypothetical protein
MFVRRPYLHVIKLNRQIKQSSESRFLELLEAGPAPANENRDARSREASGYSSRLA